MPPFWSRLELIPIDSHAEVLHLVPHEDNVFPEDALCVGEDGLFRSEDSVISLDLVLAARVAQDDRTHFFVLSAIDSVVVGVGILAKLPFHLLLEEQFLFTFVSRGGVAFGPHLDLGAVARDVASITQVLFMSPSPFVFGLVDATADHVLDGALDVVFAEVESQEALGRGGGEGAHEDADGEQENDENFLHGSGTPFRIWVNVLFM